MTKASDLFVQALENEGVEFIFGIPGEENLDMLESLRKSKIQLILTRHEQGAGFMAATYGRLTGRVGVCLATLGPGATNLVTPAAYAQLGAMPMLMITGQKPVKKNKQGRFQIVDIVEMMRPITKFSRQIVNGNNVPVVVREAIRIAQLERPGAVHIELPEDIAREECDDNLFEVIETRRPSADYKAVDVAVNMINRARRPLLLIGAGANRNLTRKALGQFIDRTGIYFFNTQMGKGVVDERHPNCLGTAALSDHDYLHHAIDAADLIINVGHDVIEKPPFFMEPGGTKVIHINHFSAVVDDVYFPQLNVVGDIAGSVKMMTGKLSPNEEWDHSIFATMKKGLDEYINEKKHDDRFPVIPQHLVYQVRKAMPDDGIIALDNGMYKIWFARNYKAYMPNTVLLDNALATMGAGLPSAMAAKIVHPERKVMAICGDGGFMMNSQEIETAIRLKLDLVIVILHDDSYGMIRWKQAGMDFDDWGLNFGNPDFVKYAESYGAKGWRVENCTQLSTLLTQCLNEPGVHIVDVPIDYAENEQLLMGELKRRVSSLIDAEDGA